MTRESQEKLERLIRLINKESLSGLLIHLQRGISNQAYDQIALAIAGYEASPDVNVIMGLLGVWFHGGKDLVGDLRQILLAWTIPLGTNGGTKVSADPPVIAPLAFVGLGLIGFLACSRRFSGDSST